MLAAADPSAIRIAGDSSYRSLEEARSDAESATVLCGDDGGQIYLTVPTRYVACDERTLRGLLVALDAMEWNEPAMATLAFRRAPVGSNLFAGLGGATVIDGVWVHPRLEDAGVRAAAASVIYGRQTLAEVVRELAALARLR
ncbi:MAG: hypothetical protein ACREM2_03315 [Vulcanimicrobiaceae bacterium]